MTPRSVFGDEADRVDDAAVAAGCARVSIRRQRRAGVGAVIDAACGARHNRRRRGPRRCASANQFQTPRPARCTSTDLRRSRDRSADTLGGRSMSRLAGEQDVVGRPGSTKMTFVARAAVGPPSGVALRRLRGRSWRPTASAAAADDPAADRHDDQRPVIGDQQPVVARPGEGFDIASTSISRGGLGRAARASVQMPMPLVAVGRDPRRDPGAVRRQQRLGEEGQLGEGLDRAAAAGTAAPARRRRQRPLRRRGGKRRREQQPGRQQPLDQILHPDKPARPTG